MNASPSMYLDQKLLIQKYCFLGTISREENPQGNILFTFPEFPECGFTEHTNIHLGPCGLKPEEFPTAASLSSSVHR